MHSRSAGRHKSHTHAQPGSTPEEAPRVHTVIPAATTIMRPAFERSALGLRRKHAAPVKTVIPTMNNEGTICKFLALRLACVKITEPCAEQRMGVGLRGVAATFAKIHKRIALWRRSPHGIIQHRQIALGLGGNLRVGDLVSVCGDRRSRLVGDLGQQELDLVHNSLPSFVCLDSRFLIFLDVRLDMVIILTYLRIVACAEHSAPLLKFPLEITEGHVALREPDRESIERQHERIMCILPSFPFWLVLRLLCSVPRDVLTPREEKVQG